jgi:preprotein translocase subunit SecE
MGRLIRKKPVKKKSAAKDIKKSKPSESIATQSKDIKKSSSAFQPQVKPVIKERKDNLFSKAVQFLKEVKVEIKKVVWPTKKQTLASTLAVLVLIIIISLFLGLVDTFLSWVVGFILR